MSAVHGQAKCFPRRVAFGLFLAASLSAMVQADEVFRVGIIAGDAHRNEFQYVPQKATDGWEFRTYLFADGADEATLKGKLYADMSNDLDMVVFTPSPPKTLIVAGDKENLAMWKSFVGRGGAFAVTDAHDNWWRPLLCGDWGYGLGHEFRAIAYSYPVEYMNKVVDCRDHPHHPFRDFPSAQIDGMNTWSAFLFRSDEVYREDGFGEEWEWVDVWEPLYDVIDQTQWWLRGYGAGSIIAHYEKGTVFMTASRKPYFPFFENLRAATELRRAGLKVVRSACTGFSNNLERVSFTVAKANKSAIAADDFTVSVLATGNGGTSCSSNFTGRTVADGLEFSFNFLNTVHGDGTLKVWLVGKNGEDAVIIDRKQTFDDVIVPVLPRYRSRVSTCRRRSEVQLGFRTNPAYVRKQAETWTARVLDASGREWWQATGNLAVSETGKTFWADVPKSAPAGDYCLSVTVAGPGGDCTREATFKIVAPTDTQVLIHQDNVLLRGGRPWLPIGLYGCTAGDWERVWKMGIDLQHAMAWQMGNESHPFAEMCEMKQPVLFELAVQNKFLENCRNWARIMSSLPCAGMMYSVDEPTDPDIPHWEDIYKAMAEAAPDNPVYYANRYPTSARYQSGIADIMASSCYSADVTWNPSCLDIMREQMGDAKPVFAIMNTSNVADEDKFRVAAYLSLVHGAKGLMWYYWPTVKNTGFEGYFARLIPRIRRLEPYLFSSRTQRLALAGGAVHALDCGDELTGRKLICVNPTASAVEVTDVVEGFATPFTVPPMDVLVLDGQTAAAVDMHGADLSIDANSPWMIDTTVSKAGGSSLRSGNPKDGRSSVSMTVDGPGTITFWWRTGTGAGSGAFCVDGTSCAVIKSAVSEWQRHEIVVEGSGKHALRWDFLTDKPEATADAGLWLDLVQWIAVDSPRVTESSPLPVPYEWLSKYGLNVDCDVETAAMRTTAKGTLAWQEYVMGTDPSDVESRLRLMIEMKNGKPSLSWEPVIGEGSWDNDRRFYTLLGCESLFDGLKQGKWEPADETRHKFFKVELTVRPH